MSAAIANPENAINKTVYELTEMQLKTAIEMARNVGHTDKEIVAAILVALATNFNAMKSK